MSIVLFVKGLFSKVLFKKVAIFTSVIIVISLVVTFAQVVFFPTAFSRFYDSAKLIGFSNQNQSSVAKIVLDGKKVKLSFQLAEQDRVSVAQFSNNLGVGMQWLQGISIVLDEQSIVLLHGFLPTELKVQITPNKIVFGNLPVTNNQLFDPNLFAESSVSGTKKIIVNHLSNGGYIININNPDQVLSQAVNSGQIKLSEALTEQGLWQLLNKVDRIKIEVQGQLLNGEITLR